MVSDACLWGSRGMLQKHLGRASVRECWSADSHGASNTLCDNNSLSVAEAAITLCNDCSVCMSNLFTKQIVHNT